MCCRWFPAVKKTSGSRVCVATRAHLVQQAVHAPSWRDVARSPQS